MECVSLSACIISFGGSWLIDCGVNCKLHDQEQTLLFASLQPSNKYNPRKECGKIVFMSKARVERTISKSKT